MGIQSKLGGLRPKYGPGWYRVKGQHESHFFGQLGDAKLHGCLTSACGQEFKIEERYNRNKCKKCEADRKSSLDELASRIQGHGTS